MEMTLRTIIIGIPIYIYIYSGFNMPGFSSLCFSSNYLTSDTYTFTEYVDQSDSSLLALVVDSRCIQGKRVIGCCTRNELLDLSMSFKALLDAFLSLQWIQFSGIHVWE